MGPLRLIQELPEDFLVMNGDILTDLDFAGFLAEHVAQHRLFTIAAAEREQKIDYGVLQVDDTGLLTAFVEKPKIPYLVSMGVYAVSRQVVDVIPEGRPFGFDDLLLQLLADARPVAVRPHHGYWLDIGRPDDYEKAVEDWPEISCDLRL
jgi:NDP-sugar pyrophosphorylase family protein